MDNKIEKTLHAVKDKIDDVVPDKEDFKRVADKLDDVMPDKEDFKRAIDKTGDIVDKALDGTKSVASGVVSVIDDKTDDIADAVKNKVKKDDEDEDHYVKRKKDMIFQDGESLQQVVNVVNEAAMALHDNTRTIRESAIPEVLSGALGAGVGGVGSFAALYGLGTVGLSAAGITSGLAAAGAIVGGGMVAGIFVLAAPIAALSAGGVAVASAAKRKQLRQEKERLYKEALLKHQGIIKALEEENEENRERLDYLQSLNILLERAIKDLRQDLGETAGVNTNILKKKSNSIRFFCIRKRNCSQSRHLI